MWKWLKGIFKAKKTVSEEVTNPIGCSTCVWWKAEEENGVEILGNKRIRYCDIAKDYTHKNYTCPGYIEELFEATPNSTQTEEKVIKHEFIVDRNDENDTRIEKK